ncbi:MAG: shikimate kinase [Candidatus Neomarinimicrobiota bacterium]
MELTVKNIFLIGMMGSGKTSAGRLLASSIHWQFVDLDAEIERPGGKTVDRIFHEDGEAYFRELEADRLRQIAAGRRQVIATGGGAVLLPENRRLIGAGGVAILLRTAAVTLIDRVGDGSSRPLLNGEQDKSATLCNIWEERENYYRELAAFTVDTDELTAAEVAEQVASWLKENYGNNLS